MSSASKIATMSATLRPTRYSPTSSGLPESPKPRRSGAIVRETRCVERFDLVAPEVRAVRKAVEQEHRRAVARRR